MAYSDYGAFVYLNGDRRPDKEDAPTFATDEETFGRPTDEIVVRIHHGILGDGNIRVACHKQGLPTIWEITEDGFNEIKYIGDDVDYFDYDTVKFEYNGYQFSFESGNPYVATMIEPNGDKWVCEYDYQYGAGF